MARLMAGKNDKPRAVAFIDFEHWYISLDKLYSKKPDLKDWRDKLSKSYNVREILVFADFSNQALRAEIPKIREVTSSIIETQNASVRIKKDYTDFIMLDHIYQKALSSHDIQAFIIFSGDGHFSSVASFLRNQCGKTVGVYGIKNAVSGQLKNTASWCVELPEERKEEANKKYYDMILKNLKYLESNNRGKKRLYPTFWGTVDAVASYYNVRREAVTKALRELIELNYIFQTEEKIDAKKSIKVLNVDWKVVAREGVYPE
ncbi:MAG: NYN domain-containing protein [Eubacteriales bacterium]|nr:NYN domain-containing protein [Eubacteriales bacterium]